MYRPFDIYYCKETETLNLLSLFSVLVRDASIVIATESLDAEYFFYFFVEILKIKYERRLIRKCIQYIYLQ
jgi:hypothetical protein